MAWEYHLLELRAVAELFAKVCRADMAASKGVPGLYQSVIGLTVAYKNIMQDMPILISEWEGGRVVMALRLG